MHGDNVLEGVFKDIEMDGLMNEPGEQARAQKMADESQRNKEISAAGGEFAGQENTDSDHVLKKMFGDLDSESTVREAEKHHVMRDADNQKIDAVTENR